MTNLHHRNVTWWNFSSGVSHFRSCDAHNQMDLAVFHQMSVISQYWYFFGDGMPCRSNWKKHIRRIFFISFFHQFFTNHWFFHQMTTSDVSVKVSSAKLSSGCGYLPSSWEKKIDIYFNVFITKNLYLFTMQTMSKFDRFQSFWAIWWDFHHMAFLKISVSK